MNNTEDYFLSVKNILQAPVKIDNYNKNVNLESTLTDIAAD